MTDSRLQDQTQGFASDLNSLIGGVLGIDDAFQVARRNQDSLIIEVDGFHPRDSPGLPLMRESDEITVLFLRVGFSVTLDSQNEFLQVDNSIFGLWVKTPGRKSPQPFVRVEYDRDKVRASPAHIQIHAKSEDLEWIDESAGRSPPRPLQKLHFPAGGRRFRATLEDFLLFLDRDRIFTSWQPGWERIVEKSRDKWEQNQVRATVRRYPELTAKALEKLGYQVVQPPSR